MAILGMRIAVSLAMAMAMTMAVNGAGLASDFHCHHRVARATRTDPPSTPSPLASSTVHTYEYLNPNLGTRGVACVIHAPRTRDAPEQLMLYVEEEAASSAFDERRAAVGWAHGDNDHGSTLFTGVLFPLGGSVSKEQLRFKLTNTGTGTGADIGTGSLTFTTESGTTLVWNNRDQHGVPGWQMLPKPLTACHAAHVQLRIAPVLPGLPGAPPSGIVCLDPLHVATAGQRHGTVGFFATGLRPAFHDPSTLIPFVDFGLLDALQPVYDNVYRGTLVDLPLPAPGQQDALTPRDRIHPRRFTAVRSASDDAVLLLGDVRERWLRSSAPDAHPDALAQFVIRSQGASIEHLYGLHRLSPHAPAHVHTDADDQQQPQ